MAKIMCVSILVLMDLSFLLSDDVAKIAKNDHVSILVLMDLSFLQNYKAKNGVL